MPVTSPPDGGRVVIIGPPPTTNGDLHVGHVAGPYLAADIHARYLRATGRDVIYASGSDDSQTYVVASAAKKGTTPEALAAESWHEIRETFQRMGIGLDGFAPFDDGYRATVLEFVTRLHDAGKLRLRTVQLPYALRSGQFLMEGLVSGECPVCLAVSRGGLCETCGHPNNFDELGDPRSTIDPSEEVAFRQARVLVLPLEDYREELEAYHARQTSWRPHISGLMRELLARPLPDFPVTYPTSWGIPAPFPETPGQVINAWAEGMPASMYCTAFAQHQLGEEPATADELWLARHGIRLVYFLGFDNAWFWAMTHLALLLAHDGRYVLPEQIVCNEFYELENDKFSTSSGHVVWARDLVEEVPRDLARFYLALTAPEHARTNFSRAALDKVTAERVVGPWNELSSQLAKAVAELGVSGKALAVSPEARRRCAIMAERFAACYELEGYSLNRVADLVVQHIDRLRVRAGDLAEACGAAGRDEGIARIGDLFGEVCTFVAAASPILVDLGEASARAGAFDGPVRLDPDRARVRAFPLPLLEGSDAGSAR